MTKPINARDDQSNSVTMLCAVGTRFASALQRAVKLGHTDTYFWVVSLDESDDFWIQFTDDCVNVTDAGVPPSADYPDLSPWLRLACRSQGLYSTFKFDTPCDIAQVAAATCRYMHQMFPEQIADVHWKVRVYKSNYSK